MATINCPNCGKPLRPGARFCGSCGATLPAAEDKTIRNQAESLPPAAEQAATFACSYCGKPARVGAKFCNYCGKEILPPASPVGSGTQSSAATILKPGRPATGAGAPAVAPAAAARTDSRPRRRSIVPILAGGIGLMCILGGLAGYLFIQDPFDWRNTATAVSVAIVPSATAVPVATHTAANLPTEGLPPSPPTELVVESPTVEPPLPTETIAAPPTLTATLAITTSPPLTGTLAPNPDAPPEKILLTDEFSDALNVHWKTWGEPRPTLRKGFGDSWLELKAADEPTQAGVTCRTEIDNAPGTAIEFLAQLTPGYPQYWLHLDWDPLQFDRGPENISPTIVHLEVQKNLVLVQAPAANHSCRVELDGTIQHRYILKFISDKIVELYIDEAIQPLCSVDMGIKPVPGRISFSGNGWVTRILVTGAAVP